MTSTFARYAIVTGANAPGIGFRTAQILASPPHRFRVVLACRDEAKGLAAQHAISSADPEAWAQYVHLDLAHLESVRLFADAFRALDGGAPVKNGLSLLVCNAAVGFGRDNERKVTADGFERAMGTNHLGHFLLVNLLLPDLLLPEAGARVVVVGSSLHDPKSSGGGTSKKPTTLGDLDDLMLERPGAYEVGYAYRRSKLANMLFACELHRRLKAARCNSVNVRALEPGFIPQTALGREAGALSMFFMQWVLDGVLKWVRGRASIAGDYGVRIRDPGHLTQYIQDGNLARRVKDTTALAGAAMVRAILRPSPPRRRGIPGATLPAARPSPRSDGPPCSCRPPGEVHDVEPGSLRVTAGCHHLDRRAHPVVGAAAADVGHRRVDVGVGRPGLVAQQGGCGHDHAALAVAALRHVQRRPGLLDRMLPVRRQALDRHDLLRGLQRRHRHDARAQGRTVHVDGAGAALRHTATVLGAGQPKLLAQHPQQRGIGLGVVLSQLAIHVQGGHPEVSSGKLAGVSSMAQKHHPSLAPPLNFVIRPPETHSSPGVPPPSPFVPAPTRQP
jgi:NAD(P)-dependent dehydrogenase (short-subunit alcohol dehydrogenase family)